MDKQPGNHTPTYMFNNKKNILSCKLNPLPLAHTCNPTQECVNRQVVTSFGLKLCQHWWNIIFHLP